MIVLGKRPLFAPISSFSIQYIYICILRKGSETSQGDALEFCGDGQFSPPPPPRDLPLPPPSLLPSSSSPSSYSSPSSSFVRNSIYASDDCIIPVVNAISRGEFDEFTTRFYEGYKTDGRTVRDQQPLFPLRHS